MQTATEKLESIVDVLDWLQQRGLAEKAEVVGHWVWVEFEAKPADDVRPADSWYLKSKYGARRVRASQAEDTVAA